MTIVEGKPTKIAISEDITITDESIRYDTDTVKHFYLCG